MVVFANTPHELHDGINAIEKDCKLWTLTVNNAKTKVIVFQKRKYGTVVLMYSLINKMSIFNLSIDITLKLFDQLVVPVILYDCIIWKGG